MRILQVDYMGCLYWHYHAQDANPTWQFLKRLRDIIEQFRIDRTLLLLEGGSRYRLGLHPGYKSDRKKRNEEQTEAEKRRRAAFKKDASAFSDKLAPLFGLIPVRVLGAEADDLAGYFCNHIDTMKHQILNLSGDQDWYQLIRQNVVQGSYAEMQKLKGEPIPGHLWLSKNAFTIKYGIPVEQWIWKKCLTGDNGDSVPGFAQVGDGTALALLQTYGGIEGIKASRDTLHVPRMRGEAKIDLAINFDRVYHNYKLMNLNHTPEVEREVFGESGLASLEFITRNLEARRPVAVDELQELAYQHGWLEIDRGWLSPFCK